MFWIIAYLVIGIVTSAYVSQEGIARIAFYRAGQSILVSGTSKTHAAERARKIIEHLKVYETATESKIASMYVGGFVVTLLAWPGALYTKLFYREHVLIQKGEVVA
jgi:CO dehydrogenase/acetyl-CoA synthase epsilon subunit